ncbi:MAG: vWA domain-containing protein [Treponemataceae bacterium]|nr:vWA domain-containing protein [Treponemataceae bacterium]
MKKNIFVVLCFLFCTLAFANTNQISSKADVVILLDNSGTMLPYYDEVNSKVLTEICDNFVRLGDTFHLLSFNEKPVTEISQPVKTEADIYKIISRFNLLYPLGPYTDFPSALLYAQQYIASLDVYNQKVLIIISDGLFNPAQNSTFYNKSSEEINNTINSAISKMKSEGTHIYYIKAPFPENLNLKSLADESVTNVAKQPEETSETSADETVYFEYGTTLENLPEVSTTPLIPDEDTTYNSDSFIGPILSMPELSTKKDLGNKKLSFSLPITIKNTSDEKIKLELKQILINETNVLKDSIFVNIASNKSKKINAKIKMPKDTQLGQQQIFAECVFADNVRTRPQFLDFFVNFKSGTNIFANFKNIGFTILIILLILLAIILLLFLLLSISKKHKEEDDEERKAKQTNKQNSSKQPKDDESIYNEAKTIPDNNSKKNSNKSSVAVQSSNDKKDSNTTLVKKSTSTNVGVDKSNSNTLNNYENSNSLSVSGDVKSNRMDLNATTQKDSLSITGDGSSNRMNLDATKQKSTLTLDGVEKYKNSNSGLRLASAQNEDNSSKNTDDTKSSYAASNKMTMPTFTKPEGLRLPAIGTKSSSNNITPASSSDTIESKSDKDITLELYVEGQNKNIGKRNIHTLTPGSRRSVGGGLSSFSIFLVQVPSSIAEVRYDGESCSLALLQPEYFPEANSNIIENCINKKIKVKSDKGYEMTITIRPYEDQTDKLNNLLLSIFDDSQKQRYSKN